MPMNLNLAYGIHLVQPLGFTHYHVPQSFLDIHLLSALGNDVLNKTKAKVRSDLEITTYEEWHPPTKITILNFTWVGGK